MDKMKHHCVSLVPLFNHLDEKDQEIINHLAHHQEFQKGETIISPLEDGKLVIVAKGAVKLYQLNANGKEQLLRVMEPGDFEGDQELFGTKNENTYGEALQNTTVCMVDKKDFEKLLLKHPEIALKLLKINSQKLLQAEKQAQFLATDSIEERLGSYLLDLMKAKGSPVVELPFKLKELATFIGTTPETISRKMKDFEKKGWIKRNKKEIEILDPDCLEEI